MWGEATIVRVALKGLASSYTICLLHIGCDLWLVMNL
jgi:hypothetical protein